ncbi:MAG: hydrogenase maturation protease [Azoarcus sp.]|nr:hydrogenase maturation protease [Azoarcus sp.]MDD2872483.1 hydrogenase maturation protease [Azoarcus sp.]MDX9836759.1 hydrogenase maturation protease [Azoarcus sp.]
MTAIPGLVVFAIGNDARGDDALGPQLGARIEQASPAGVEVLVEYQLQIEHALDLRGAAAVLFIDAAVGLEQPFDLHRIEPDTGAPLLSHALSPEVLLAVFQRVEGRAPPPAFVFALQGESFALGEPLSAVAEHALEAAWAWLASRLSTAGLLSAVGDAGAQHQQCERAGHDAPEGRAHAEQ